MMKSGVSVIVSFYNAEKYLEGCLDSLTGQTLKDIQIILVDDGSTDAGLSLIKEMATEHENVLVLHKENSGQGDSRNVGFAKAEKKYIYYMDVDDFIAEDALEKLYLQAEIYNADMVVFNSINILDDVPVVPQYSMIPNSKVLGGLYTKRSLEAGVVFEGKEYVKRSLSAVEGFFPPVWISFYRRDFLLNSHVLFEKIIHEDNIYSMETALAAQRVVYINDTLHFRRIVASSITNQKKTEKHIVGALRVLEHASALYDREKKDLLMKKALHHWTLLSAGIAYSEMMNCSKTIRRKHKKEFIGLLLQDIRKYNPQLVLKSIIKV